MADKKVRWYLDLKCDCGAAHSFEVTETEVATGKASPGQAPARGAPVREVEREYYYLCYKCKIKKIALYTSQDIKPVEEPEEKEPGGV